MKDVRAPGVIAPLIVRVAPYITTTITDRVDAAFKLPEKRPTTFCRRKNEISGFPSHPFTINLSLSLFFSCAEVEELSNSQPVQAQALRSHQLSLNSVKSHNLPVQMISPCV